MKQNGRSTADWLKQREFPAEKETRIIGYGKRGFRSQAARTVTFVLTVMSVLLVCLGVERGMGEIVFRSTGPSSSLAWPW